MKIGILALCALSGLACGAAAQVVEADSRLGDGVHIRAELDSTFGKIEARNVTINGKVQTL